MISLRHRPAGAPGRWEVAFRGAQILAPVVVDERELRRFAWAVLSDLDPEEALRAAAEDETPPRRVVLADGDLVRPAPARGTMSWLCLAALKNGPLTSGQVHRAAGLQGCTDASALLCRLRRDRLVDRTDDRATLPRGGRGVWSLTPAGRAVLEEAARP